MKLLGIFIFGFLAMLYEAVVLGYGWNGIVVPIFHSIPLTFIQVIALIMVWDALRYRHSDFGLDEALNRIYTFYIHLSIVWVSFVVVRLFL